MDPAMLVQLGDVHFGYPGTEIFTGLTLQVNPGDRIGLVGPNGTGKSTLLRLLDGALKADGGSIARTRGIRIAYLKQSQEFAGRGTIYDSLLMPFAELLAMRAELDTLATQLDTERALARYGELEARYTEGGGYTIESRAKALASDLGFTDDDLQREVETLSGGERGRLELARTLLVEPDLLLLDEPTNHLDVAATEHLEERLREWKKAFVLVSHDRYFLKATCKDIVEVEDGKAVRFAGGYDKYVVERAARRDRLEAMYEKQQEHIQKTEDFIRRNLAGVNTKQAQGRRKQLEKLERIERVADEFKQAGEIGLKFSVGDHPGGKEAMKADALAVGYAGSPPLVRGLDFTIYRGDRIGIVGPNGAGKSTLMKTLLGKLAVLSGHAELGHEVRVGYFDQKLSELDENKSLIDEVRSIRGDFNEDVARQFLGRFRFSGDDPFKKVKGLSGGERNRLSLAKMMLRPRNLLALDEPTNHLDIPAREVLEEALVAYAGTVICISHDRYFLDRVATKILYLEGGLGTLHAGNYTDLHDRLAAAKHPPKVVAPPVQKKTVAAAPSHEANKARSREADKKKRRLAELEKSIATEEADVQKLTAELTGAHAGDWQKLHDLVADKDKVEERLLRHMSEWEKLSAELA
ncbi:MAG: ABC-F family ATP-binding cassette domain-containing protein [Polyangia bacterium]